jgi:hypothetical protein
MGLLTGSDEGIRVGRRVVGTFAAPSARTLDMAVVQWQLEEVG